MTVLGLSVVAVLSVLFCYRHPPASWAILTWFRQQSDDTKFNREPYITTISEKEKVTTQDGDSRRRKDEEDRKAMPPPPPPPPKVQPRPVARDAPLRNPRADTAATTGSSAPTIGLENDVAPLTSSFPALNSIQRASSGARKQPPTTNRSSLQPPLRSAMLLTPPLRSPAVNRSPNAGRPSSLQPPPTHNSIPTKPRNKVELAPGHSPLDWASISNNPSSNMRGLPPSTPYLRVTPSLLRQYTGRKGKDAWTVLSGNVYNITPYIPYHPGGEPELLRAAGRDGTKLFGEVHPWVNWEGMLAPCLVGIAVAEEEIRVQSPLEDMD